MAKQTFALGNFYQPAQSLDSVAEVVALINQYRQDAGLPPYALNDSLTSAAQRVADSMAATEFISHYDGEGANPARRAEEAGYADHVTEIIYGGFGGSAAAWDWWTTNETNVSLILSQDYHEFGIGMAVGEESGRAYWAVMFGTGTSATAVIGRPTTTTPGLVTKLPPAEETAVPVPTLSTSATSDDASTATTASTLGEATTLVTLTGLAGEAPTFLSGEAAATDATTLGTPTLPAATPAPTATANESPWLVITAAVIILLGIIIFYFPRLGWTRP